jgi:hypothetical protein
MQPGPITYMPAPEMTPMQMLQIAVSQGADLERIQKLMDLQDRWEAKQALHAFNAALAAFKKNPPVIVKDLMNKQYTNAWYTSLGNLVNTTNAALGEHGLSASWQIEQGETVSRSRASWSTSWVIGVRFGSKVHRIPLARKTLCNRSVLR